MFFSLRNKELPNPISSLLNVPLNAKPYWKLWHTQPLQREWTLNYRGHPFAPCPASSQVDLSMCQFKELDGHLQACFATVSSPRAHGSSSYSPTSSHSDLYKTLKSKWSITVCSLASRCLFELQVPAERDFLRPMPTFLNQGQPLEQHTQWLSRLRKARKVWSQQFSHSLARWNLSGC